MMHPRLRHAYRLILIVAIGVTLLGGCAAPPQKPAALTPGDYDYAKRQTAWLINKEMREHKGVGLSIAMVDDQRIVWAEGFGYARKSKKVLASAETVYQVGSISKLFTATAVMQLAEGGKIDIDKPLESYLPQFAVKTRFPDAGPITPRTVMTHHSGLPSDRAKAMFWPASETPTESFTDVATLLHDAYVANPPNFVFSYSNLGVSLLGHMVQQVSGEDFVTHMNTAVLGPLGMTRSSYVLTGEIEALLSKAYMKGKEIDPFRLRDLPAGSLMSNVTDLSRLMMMVFADGRAGDRQVLKPQTLAEMLRPQNTDEPLDVDLRIGLGWFLTSGELHYAAPVAGHAGSTIVHNSMLTCLPKHKLGVVVLCNSDTGSGIVVKVANEALKLMVETKTGLKPPEKPRDTRPPLAKRSARDLKPYAGYYATMAGAMPFRVEGGRLKTRLMGVPIRLLPLADGQFLPRFYLLGLIPLHVDVLEGIRLSITDLAGHRALVLVQNGRGVLMGEKIDPPPLPPRWQRLAGNYEIANRGKEIALIASTKVRYEGGFLLADIKLLGGQSTSMAIKPLSDTEGIIMGLGRNAGDTIFLDSRDGHDVLRWMGYEFRKKSQPVRWRDEQ